MKRDLIDITDLTVEEIDELIAKAEDIIEHPEVYREKCRYKKLATLPLCVFLFYVMLQKAVQFFS